MPKVWEGGLLADRYMVFASAVEVAKNNPTPWEFKKSGNYWRIVTGGMELSWGLEGKRPDGVLVRRGADWDLRTVGKNTYRIINQDGPASWWGAELAWDGTNGNPKASVEHDDPTDWEIIPATEFKPHWEFSSSVGGDSKQFEYNVGVTTTNAWSKSTTLEKSVSSGVSTDDGYSQSTTAMNSVTKTVSEAISSNVQSTQTENFIGSTECRAVFQWYVTASSEFMMYRNADAEIKTNNLACTPGAGVPPRCYPGRQATNDYQQCNPDGYTIGYTQGISK